MASALIVLDCSTPHEELSPPTGDFRKDLPYAREGSRGGFPYDLTRARMGSRGTFRIISTRARESGMKKGLFPPGTSFKAYLPSPDWLRDGVEHPLTKIGRARGLLIVDDRSRCRLALFKLCAHFL